MRLLNIGVVIAVIWIVLLTIALKRNETAEIPRLRRNGFLASTSLLSLLVWSAIRWYAPPVSIFGRWGMVALCLIGLSTSGAAAVSVLRSEVLLRAPIAFCAVLFALVFALGVIVSMP